MAEEESHPCARDICWALGRLRTGRARIEVPAAVGLHRRHGSAVFHPDPELFLQIGGGTEFDTPAGVFVLRAGDFCIMPAGVPHGEVPLDFRTRYGIRVFMRSGADTLAVEARADRQRRIHSANATLVPGSAEAFRVLESAGASVLLHPDHRQRFLRSLVETFLTAALSMVLHPGLGRREPIPHLVSEAEKWIRLHISQPELTVALVAQALSCSPDHLSRVFRAVHGVGLNAWITRERIQLACDLLARSARNVSEIAWSCGFRQPSYFIRVFRSRMGQTPREWRETKSGVQAI